MGFLSGKTESFTSESLSNDIDEFAASIAELAKAAEGNPNRSFRKVLYLVMIDGLSSIRYPGKNDATKRFVDFVKAYALWPEGERISLPQAKLYLAMPRKKPFPSETVAVSEEISRRLLTWPHGQILDLKHDPFLNELGCDDCRYTLYRCQHFMLLWQLRNSLLHSFRHPAFAVDELSNSPKDPFYHGVCGSPDWMLAYPDAFLHRLLFNCIGGLIGWLREQGSNPFPLSRSGLWVVDNGFK